jgi:hypothetical protein
MLYFVTQVNQGFGKKHIAMESAINIPRETQLIAKPRQEKLKNNIFKRLAKFKSLYSEGIQNVCAHSKNYINQPFAGYKDKIDAISYLQDQNSKSLNTVNNKFENAEVEKRVVSKVLGFMQDNVAGIVNKSTCITIKIQYLESKIGAVVSKIDRITSTQEDMIKDTRRLVR